MTFSGSVFLELLNGTSIQSSALKGWSPNFASRFSKVSKFDSAAKMMAEAISLGAIFTR